VVWSVGGHGLRRGGLDYKFRHQHHLLYDEADVEEAYQRRNAGAKLSRRLIILLSRAFRCSALEAREQLDFFWLRFERLVLLVREQKLCANSRAFPGDGAWFLVAKDFLLA